MFENILKQSESGMGIIKINRPETRNALNKKTLQEIEEAIEIFENDESIKVIILTGEGEKSFAAGADIKQLRDRKMLEALVPGMQATYKRIEDCGKATIAAINGFALGGGFELALACDIRVAAAEVKIGLPELNLAIVPGAGGTQRLSRIVGKGKAMEMVLTGKLMDGKEAEQWGIVTKAVPKEQLLEEAKAIANTIAAKGPVAVKLAKMTINKGFDTDLDTALMLEKFAQTIAFGTEDKNEGTQAFLDKRKPEFMSQ